MTFKGPFQPELFYDTVNTGTQVFMDIFLSINFCSSKLHIVNITFLGLIILNYHSSKNVSKNVSEAM